MKDLLIQLRAMQLFYHNAHHLVARMPFFSDHEALKEFYEHLDGDYDDVAERLIGLTGSENLNLQLIILGVQDKLQQIPPSFKENSMYFEMGLKLEQELYGKVDFVIKSGITEGTKQLLGEILNQSEMRVYKIKQRIKK